MRDIGNPGGPVPTTSNLHDRLIRTKEVQEQTLEYLESFFQRVHSRDVSAKHPGGKVDPPRPPMSTTIDVIQENADRILNLVNELNSIA